MTPARPAAARPDLRASLALAGYAALVLALLAITFGTVADLLERRAQVDAAGDILARMQGRRASSATGTDAAFSGSPFVEGPTVTVAGANLLQRVAGAVTRVEGRIMSSRVELQAAPLGPGFIGVTVDFESGQGELQRVLYDLEAGLPFLFLDQVVVQTGDRGEGEPRLRVLLTTYGRWQQP